MKTRYLSIARTQSDHLLSATSGPRERTIFNRAMSQQRGESRVLHQLQEASVGTGVSPIARRRELIDGEDTRVRARRIVVLQGFDDGSNDLRRTEGGRRLRP